MHASWKQSTENTWRGEAGSLKVEPLSDSLRLPVRAKADISHTSRTVHGGAVCSTKLLGVKFKHLFHRERPLMLSFTLLLM